jgi:hypothetical protein|tara:strand:- start:59 stop:235 length:177 start_codon:yes stop_codon:yes gene_type:complete
MDIKEAKYYKNGFDNVCGIKLTLMDGRVMYVPRSVGNTEFDEIQKQVKEGKLTIKDAD